MRPSRRRHDPSREDQTPNVPVNWRRLFGYLGPYKLRMALAIGALAVYSAVGLVFPLVIGNLINSLHTITAGQTPDFSLINSIAGGLLALFFIQAAFSFVQGYN